MIFLELVPNNIQKLIEEAQWATNTFKDIVGINVPDILRISNRSYDSVTHLANHNIKSIPHIRLCDFEFNELESLCQKLLEKNVHHILLISGDPPPNPLQPVYNHNIVDVIKSLAMTFPKLSFYAGHDPYRQSLKDEYEYSEKKLKAGAKGLFTQPLFDINLTKMLLNLPISGEWFIGISPVLTEPSYNYWVTRNNVVFPSDFSISNEHNDMIGKIIIEECKQANQHNYIMPIKADIKKYLKNIL